MHNRILLLLLLLIGIRLRRTQEQNKNSVRGINRIVGRGLGDLADVYGWSNGIGYRILRVVPRQHHPCDPPRRNSRGYRIGSITFSRGKKKKKCERVLFVVVPNTRIVLILSSSRTKKNVGNDPRRPLLGYIIIMTEEKEPILFWDT